LHRFHRSVCFAAPGFRPNQVLFGQTQQHKVFGSACRSGSIAFVFVEVKIGRPFLSHFALRKSSSSKEFTKSLVSLK
jgi:hypothetical protein